MQCESNVTCNDLGFMRVSIFVCNGFGVKKKKVTVKKMVKKRKTIKRIIVVKEKKLLSQSIGLTLLIYKKYNVCCSFLVFSPVGADCIDWLAKNASL